MNEIAEQLSVFQQALQDAPFKFAFIGGSALSLLISRKGVADIRVSKDVDIIVDAPTLPRYHDIEDMLREMGFKNDTSDDAPLCRWIYKGRKIDVLPQHESVLNWRSKWFPEAFDSIRQVKFLGRTYPSIAAPYFVALKIEAFEDRGKSDFLGSQDFEDVICVFNGRKTLVDEILAEDRLSKYLAGKFKKYLLDPRCSDAIEGFTVNEQNADECRALILAEMRRLADTIS